MKANKNLPKLLMLSALFLSLSFVGCKKEKISPSEQRSIIPGGAILSAKATTKLSASGPSRIDQTPGRATNNMQNENRRFSTLSNP